MDSMSIYERDTCMSIPDLWKDAKLNIDVAFAQTCTPEPTITQVRAALWASQKASANLQNIEQLLMGIKPPSTKP